MHLQRVSSEACSSLCSSVLRAFYELEGSWCRAKVGIQRGAWGLGGFPGTLIHLPPGPGVCLLTGGSQELLQAPDGQR